MIDRIPQKLRPNFFWVPAGGMLLGAYYLFGGGGNEVSQQNYQAPEPTPDSDVVFDDGAFDVYVAPDDLIVDGCELVGEGGTAYNTVVRKMGVEDPVGVPIIHRKRRLNPETGDIEITDVPYSDINGVPRASVWPVDEFCPKR